MQVGRAAWTLEEPAEAPWLDDARVAALAALEDPAGAAELTAGAAEETAVANVEKIGVLGATSVEEETTGLVKRPLEEAQVVQDVTV